MSRLSFPLLISLILIINTIPIGSSSSFNQIHTIKDDDQQKMMIRLYETYADIHIPKDVEIVGVSPGEWFDMRLRTGAKLCALSRGCSDAAPFGYVIGSTV